MEREHRYDRQALAGCRRARALSVSRYLWSSGLPILAFLTLLCVGLLLGRRGHGGWRRYDFLLWNLFLAWTPYLFSLAADLLSRVRPRARGQATLPAALAVLWLAFLPNAPYILTDFIHLRRVPSTSYGYDVTLIATFAATGCLLGATSLLVMQSLVERYAGRAWGWAFVVGIVGLSGVGIYMGRVLRWNSWDLFTRPLYIIDTVADALRDPLGHPRAITLSVLLAVFLLSSYVLFYMLWTWLLGPRRAADDRQPACGGPEAR
jgi:uncharacterized membrane protein